MFLRSQLVFRFPVSLLRLGCNSAPSTSYSSSLSTASFAVSRCNNHVIDTSSSELARHFGASLVWIRGHGKSSKKEEETQTEQSEGSSEKSGGEDSIEQLAKKMKYLSLAIFGLFVLTLIESYVCPALANNRIPSDAPRVDFATFVEKYLKAGEIRKIDVILGSEYIVATLHEGATIDGIPVETRQIVITYPHLSRHFLPAVRREESAMGISRSKGVFIHQELKPYFWIAALSNLFGAGCILYLFRLILSKNGVPAFQLIVKKLEKSIKKVLGKK